jgi:uncharacterized membrane protein YqhA
MHHTAVEWSGAGGDVSTDETLRDDQAATETAGSPPEGRLAQNFEAALWGSRLLVLVAVVSSVILAFVVFVLATVDVVHLIGKLTAYADLGLARDARAELRSQFITTIVKMVDLYLIGAILIIFALGLYELFVGRLEVAERSATGARLLLIRSLDDLKDRLAKLILLLLVVEVFQQAVRLRYDQPLDVLYLAVAILAVGGALALSKPTAKT